MGKSAKMIPATDIAKISRKIVQGSIMPAIPSSKILGASLKLMNGQA